jgi:hypothetical protein
MTEVAIGDPPSRKIAILESDRLTGCIWIKMRFTWFRNPYIVDVRSTHLRAVISKRLRLALTIFIPLRETSSKYMRYFKLTFL